ncbi:MAG: hypothetical protein AAFQ79_09415 [Pseudomonadota bacterium]
MLTQDAANLETTAPDIDNARRTKLRAAIAQLLREPALGQSVARRIPRRKPDNRPPRSDAETALAVLLSRRRRDM